MSVSAGSDLEDEETLEQIEAADRCDEEGLEDKPPDENGEVCDGKDEDGYDSDTTLKYDEEEVKEDKSVPEGGEQESEGEFSAYHFLPQLVARVRFDPPQSNYAFKRVEWKEEKLHAPNVAIPPAILELLPA